jgi:hypothetical protein
MGRYTHRTKTFDALIFGHYDGHRLIYAARTRNEFTPASRVQLFCKFKGPAQDMCFTDIDVAGCVWRQLAHHCTLSRRLDFIPDERQRAARINSAADATASTIRRWRCVGER